MKAEDDMTDANHDEAIQFLREGNIEWSAFLMDLRNMVNAGYYSLTDKQAAAVLRIKANAGPVNAKPVAEGYYIRDGRAYHVISTRDGARAYAKVLRIINIFGRTAAGWAYDPGAIHSLRPEMRATEEQAAAFGKANGVCIVCAKTLTDKAAISRGISAKCLRTFRSIA